MPTKELQLHHYTSGIGILGIFDSDCIWATLIHSLNDSKEFSHAIEQARVYMITLRHECSDSTTNLINEALCESLDRVANINVFVACLSEMADSLSQWRGYCPPGFGYSIGFFDEELRNLALPQGFKLHQCIYDNKEQRRLVQQWADEAILALKTTLPADADPEEHVKKNCHHHFTKFVAFAPIIKHRAFKDEREWRLVGTVPINDPRVKLRAGRSMLLPYVPIKLDLSTNRSLVGDLTVGPTPNMKLALSAATHFFLRTKINGGICPSTVPYREW